MHARGGTAGIEVAGALERSGVFPKGEQPRVAIARGAVGLDESGVGEEGARGLRTRAVLGVLLGHAARIVHRDEGDPVRHGRRDFLDPRWLQQEQEHERQAEQTKNGEDEILQN